MELEKYRVKTVIDGQEKELEIEMEPKKEPFQHITDDNGINFYIRKPKEGQLCQCKKRGENGHVGHCVYRNGYFETFRDFSNRVEIIRWKADLWLPL
jgi:hypothetical protein